MNTPPSPQRRRRLFQLLGLLGLVLMAVLLWRPLVTWFTGEPVRGGEARPAQAPQSTETKVAVTHQLPAPALEYVRAALNAYEAVRDLLAKDNLAGLSARASEVAHALRAAAEAAGQSPADVKEGLRAGAAAAERLGAAKNLEEARAHFSPLSQSLVILGAVDERLQEGWHLFSCPMVKGAFNKWLQRSPPLDNPYMGKAMPRCGSPADWSTAVPPGLTARAHGHGAGDISHYTCSMHPSVRQEGPGICPICGMDLTPVTKAEVNSGVIRVDEARRQRIGVKTAPVTLAPLKLDVHALGRGGAAGEAAPRRPRGLEWPVQVL